MDNPTRLLAIALLVLGTLALVYGGFTYTRSTSDVDLGLFTIQVEDRERVNVPVWAGVLGIVLGGGLLVVAERKR